MIPEKIEELVKSIIIKTNAGKANWGKTARVDEFKLFFEKGAITTDSWSLDDGNIVLFDFAIYNLNGDRIEYFSRGPIDDGYQYLSELHEVARRDYYKVDETISGLFDEIKSEKSVGKRVEESGDLPF